MGYLFALIPVLSTLALALLIHLRSSKPMLLRESLLAAAVISAGWCALGTEVLSLFHAIYFLSILLLWLLPLPVFLVVAFRNRLRFHDRPLPRFHITVAHLLLLPILFLLAWSFLQGALSPPNNADSLCYHLPRQLFWIQHHSVEHYPVTTLRQLAMPPLSEYIGMHLMVFTGSDICHNLVQWTAWLLTMLAASLITQRFGGSTTVQLLAALIVATFPMALLQSSNTKNDILVAFYSTTAAYFIFQLTDRPFRWWLVLLIGIALGELALTKGTGMIFALPLIALLTILLLRLHLRRAVPSLLAIAAISLALNAGTLLRNYQTFGSPIPNTPIIHGPDTVVNETHALPSMLSNMIRNLAPHFVTPSDNWNAAVTRYVEHLHDRLGVDVNDPKTTFYTGPFEPYDFPQDKEDLAAAPMHMAMLLLTLLLLPVLFITRRIPRLPSLALLLIALADFLLFSILLKWQLWNTRLIIAFPALLAPVVAWTCTAPRLRYFLPPSVAIALLVAILPSLNNPHRPLLGPKSLFHFDREARRYTAYAQFYAPPPALADYIITLRPKSVAISCEFNSCLDYLLERRLLDHSPTPPGPPLFLGFNCPIQSLAATEPDADVLVLFPSPGFFIRHDNTGTVYRLARRFQQYAVFVRVIKPASR